MHSSEYKQFCLIKNLCTKIHGHKHLFLECKQTLGRKVYPNQSIIFFYLSFVPYLMDAKFCEQNDSEGFPIYCSNIQIHISCVIWNVSVPHIKSSA